MLVWLVTPSTVSPSAGSFVKRRFSSGWITPAPVEMMTVAEAGAATSRASADAAVSKYNFI